MLALDSLVDLSGSLDASNRLNWRAPEGEWLLLRIGHSVALRAYTHWHTPGSGGFELDPLRASAMDLHFENTIARLAKGPKPHLLYIDSWEIGKPNWTADMPAEFRRLRGYDPLPYLPAISGETVNDAATTARFIEDYDRTLGDLTAQNYYGRLALLARQHGIGLMMQAAGYQKPCVDSLRTMGTNNFVMGEYWARTREPDGYVHQRTPAQLRFHDSIKLASAAAHIYGREGAFAESFTVWSPDTRFLDKDPYAFKDIGDYAFCQGLTGNVFTTHPHITNAARIPASGAQFGRHLTWWNMSDAYMKYLTRCQYLLRRGRFHADALYFYGEGVPNYVTSKFAMTPPLPRGYDCDSIDAEALIERLTVKNGRLRLPDGMTYRCLVMPQRQWTSPPGSIFMSEDDVMPGRGNGLPVGITLPVLQKLKQLSEAGAAIIGPVPARALGLAEDAGIANAARSVRTVESRTLEEFFAQQRLAPDFECDAWKSGANVDFIHRTDGGMEIYFISNQENRELETGCVFRVTGKQPELLDPLSGAIRELTEFHTAGGRTSVPIRFAPRQSFFVLFRKAASVSNTGQKNFPILHTVMEVGGAWELSFDPRWGGPEKVVFERLEDWTKRPEEGIRYYSGTGTYRKSFDAPPGGKRLYLDLGALRNLARVRLNGADLGVLWCPPWKVEVTDVMRPKGNRLEIEVVNLWPNRIIGDARLPKEKRITSSMFYGPDAPLLPSGLFGPVTLVR